MALRAFYESDQPLTPAYLAYRTGLSLRVVREHLASMAETGSFAVALDEAGQLEYFVPGGRRRPELETGMLPAGIGNNQRNPLLAVCLTMLVPGAGHVYGGRPGAGVAWMIATFVGYACCFVPGLLVHSLCMASAAHSARVDH